MEGTRWTYREATSRQTPAQATARPHPEKEAATTNNNTVLQIATSQIGAPDWHGKALFYNDPGKDLPMLLLRDVYIKNTSLSQTLTITIHLYAEDGQSQNFHLDSTGSNGLGVVLGKNDYGTSNIKRILGDVPPNRHYIVSPVTLKPQETISGRIPFVPWHFNKEQLETIACGALTELGTGCRPWNYTLKFTDVISETETNLRLPGRLSEK